MKHSYTALATGLLLALSSAAIAVDRKIDISVTKGDFLILNGDAFTTTHSFDSKNIETGTGIALGNVGVGSNISGGCNISFKTSNNYKLTNTNDSSIVLAKFSLLYKNKTFDESTLSKKVTTGTNCNMSAAALSLIPNSVNNDVTAGTYNDQITVTVVVAG